MTSINRLTQVVNLADDDLSVIFQTSSGRTRSISVANLKKYLISQDANAKAILQVEQDGDIVTFTAYDGSTQQIDLNVLPLHSVTELNDIPDNLEPNKFLRVNEQGNAFELVSSNPDSAQITVENNSDFLGVAKILNFVNFRTDINEDVETVEIKPNFGSDLEPNQIPALSDDLISFIPSGVTSEEDGTKSEKTILAPDKALDIGQRLKLMTGGEEFIGFDRQSGIFASFPYSALTDAGSGEEIKATKFSEFAEAEIQPTDTDLYSIQPGQEIVSVFTSTQTSFTKGWTIRGITGQVRIKLISIMADGSKRVMLDTKELGYTLDFDENEEQQFKLNPDNDNINFILAFVTDQVTEIHLINDGDSVLQIKGLVRGGPFIFTDGEINPDESLFVPYFRSDRATGFDRILPWIDNDSIYSEELTTYSRKKIDEIVSSSFQIDGEFSKELNTDETLETETVNGVTSIKVSGTTPVNTIDVSASQVHEATQSEVGKVMIVTQSNPDQGAVTLRINVDFDKFKEGQTLIYKTDDNYQKYFFSVFTKDKNNFDTARYPNSSIKLIRTADSWNAELDGNFTNIAIVENEQIVYDPSLDGAGRVNAFTYVDCPVFEVVEENNKTVLRTNLFKIDEMFDFANSKENAQFKKVSIAYSYDDGANKPLDILQDANGWTQFHFTGNMEIKSKDKSSGSVGNTLVTIESSRVHVHRRIDVDYIQIAYQSKYGDDRVYYPVTINQGSSGRTNFEFTNELQVFYKNESTGAKDSSPVFTVKQNEIDFNKEIKFQGNQLLFDGADVNFNSAKVQNKEVVTYNGDSVYTASSLSEMITDTGETVQEFIDNNPDYTPQQFLDKLFKSRFKGQYGWNLQFTTSRNETYNGTFPSGYALLKIENGTDVNRHFMTVKPKESKRIFTGAHTVGQTPKTFDKQATEEYVNEQISESVGGGADGLSTPFKLPDDVVASDGYFMDGRHPAKIEVQIKNATIEVFEIIDNYQRSTGVIINGPSKYNCWMGLHANNLRSKIGDDTILGLDELGIVLPKGLHVDRANVNKPPPITAIVNFESLGIPVGEDPNKANPQRYIDKDGNPTTEKGNAFTLQYRDITIKQNNSYTPSSGGFSQNWRGALRRGYISSDHDFIASSDSEYFWMRVAIGSTFGVDFISSALFQGDYEFQLYPNIAAASFALDNIENQQDNLMEGLASGFLYAKDTFVG